MWAKGYPKLPPLGKGSCTLGILQIDVYRDAVLDIVRNIWKITHVPVQKWESIINKGCLEDFWFWIILVGKGRLCSVMWNNKFNLSSMFDPTCYPINYLGGSKYANNGSAHP